MIKMNAEMLEEIFGDMEEVADQFNLKEIKINEFGYDPDEDIFDVSFRIKAGSEKLLELGTMAMEHLEALKDYMKSGLVSPEEIYGDEILGGE